MADGSSPNARNAEPTDSPLVQQMAQALTHMMQAQGRDDRYKNFRVHEPPVFMGGSNPMEAEEWIQRLEDIFAIMRCTDQDRVELATYKLQGEAKHWWARYRDGVNVAQAQTTWVQFRTMFLDKYFPTSLKDKKEREFLSLEQGSMTVAAYVVKFEELARFSDHFRNQPNEEWKCKRFEQGLRPEIRGHVVTQRIRNYQQLVEVCALAEQSVIDINASRQAQWKKKREEWSSRGTESEDFAHKGKKITKFAENTSTKCKTCGVVHPGQCFTNVCYFCQKPGHISRTCPDRGKQLEDASKSQVRGRVYTLDVEQAKLSGDSIRGAQGGDQKEAKGLLG